MVGVEYTFLIGGYMLSCWVDYGFNFLLPSDVSWQGPYFVQMGLSFILFSMSFFLPETPRWLARNGFGKEALQTVADLHSGGDVTNEVTQQINLEIQEAVKYEATMGKVTYKVFFTLSLCLQKLIPYLGNVHQIPQADSRRYYGANVRAIERNQCYLFLPPQLTRCCRLR